MSKLDIIREVLHSRYEAPDQNRIIEEHIGRGGKPVLPTVRNIHSPHGINHLLYRFTPDAGQEILPFFADKSGLKKLCDYVLFAEEGKNFFCLLLEMKEGSGGAKQQLKAAEAFVHYVVNAAQRIGKAITPGDVNIRLISVNERGKAKPSQTEEEPEYDSDYWTKLKTSAVRLPQLLK
ncbi:MAG: hypothetical protein ABI378_06645 [Chitinophagaceae bacterium]